MSYTTHGMTVPSYGGEARRRTPAQYDGEHAVSDNGETRRGAQRLRDVKADLGLGLATRRCMTASSGHVHGGVAMCMATVRSWSDSSEPQLTASSPEPPNLNPSGYKTRERGRRWRPGGRCPWWTKRSYAGDHGGGRKNCPIGLCLCTIGTASGFTKKSRPRRSCVRKGMGCGAVTAVDFAGGADGDGNGEVARCCAWRGRRERGRE